MGKTIYFIGQLETKAKAEGSSAKYEMAIEDLKLSNKAMVDWMHGFGNRFDADEMYKGKSLSNQKKKWPLGFAYLQQAVFRPMVNECFRQSVRSFI